MAKRRSNKLHRVYVRSILQYLGVPFDDQPATQAGIYEMMDTFKRKSPERFEEAYNLLVLHKKEDGGKPTQILAYADASKMLKDELVPLLEHQDDVLSEKQSEIRKYLDKRGVDLATRLEEKINEEIMKQAKAVQPFIIKLGNNKPKAINGVVHEKFDKLLQLAAARKNILMVGPSGSGKTHTAAQIAEALGLDYATQSMSAGVSESAFSGWLIPVGKDGQFVHVGVDFLRCYEEGGVFLFDELDAADANMLLFLNQALANDGFNLPQRHKSPRVKKHPDFVAIAAANTFGGGADVMYSGRNTLDAATLDRFRVGTVKIDYSEKVETTIIKRTDVLEWGRRIRRLITQHKLARIMSTRTLIDTQDMMDAFDWTIEDIEESYFSDWSPEELAIMNSERRAA